VDILFSSMATSLHGRMYLVLVLVPGSTHQRWSPENIEADGHFLLTDLLVQPNLLHNCCKVPRPVRKDIKFNVNQKKYFLWSTAALEPYTAKATTPTSTLRG
jgi:hypothetical protein